MELPHHYLQRLPPWLTTVSLSILFHLVLLALISHYWGRKAVPLQVPGQVISASLIFPLTTKIAVAEKPTPTEISNNTEPQPAAPLPLNEADKSAKPRAAKSERVLTSREPAVEQVTGQTDVRPELEIKGPSSLNYSILGSGKSQIEAINALKDNQLAMTASKAYQQARLSPEIKVPQRDPFVTEEEKFAKTLQIKTDCSNTLNLTLRVITGITGGVIQCSELPQIDGFIQQRLEQHTRPIALSAK